MSKVFISYRREDSAATCGRIYDRLVARFGRASVFKDVKSIPLGVDFKDYIQHIVAQCAVMLVVIGPHWLVPAGDSGQSRLFDPDDTARVEIESALTRDIAVIPVLVDRAMMPEAEQLPESVRPLVLRNGLPVRYDPDFDHDVQRVIEAVRRGAKASRRRHQPRQHTRQHLILTGVISAALVVALVLAGLLAFINLGGRLTTLPTTLPLFAVRMNSAADGWAVGDNGTFLHYTNGSWQRDASADTLAQLKSVSILGGYGWAVGRNGALVRYANGTWTQVIDTAIPPGQLVDLNSVAVVPPGGPQADAWAVGSGGTMLRYHAGVWSDVPVTGGLSAYLFGVSMLSETDGWAVGEGGTILQFDGTTWSQVSLPITSDLYALAVAPGGDLFVAGSQGTIAQDHAGQWEVYQTPTQTALLGIAFGSATDGWAIGESGTLLHLQIGHSIVTQVSAGDTTTIQRQWPTTWVSVRGPTTAYLYGIALTSPSSGWAVGDAGTLLRLANGRWTVYGH